MADKTETLLSTLKLQPVVPVIVIDDAKSAVPLARALVAGGLKAIEITLRTAAALDAIKAVADEVEGAVAGAGWNSFTTGRRKPQVKAQMTYFLPKGGSHDFKVGFETIYDWYRFGINGSNGPIRYSYPTEGAAADRIRFADTGVNSDFESTWRSSPNTDLHYAFYGQDRWTRDRLSITAGVRIDYQKVGYLDSIRKPEITDLLPDGTRIFPVESTVEGDTLVAKIKGFPDLAIKIV